jgi:hypothetical protein
MKKTTIALLTGSLLLSLTTLASATALHDAVLSGDLNKMNAALSSGATLNEAAGQYGLTALHYAADAGNAAMVKALLNKGADVNATDPGGITPLQMINMDAYYRQVESLRILVTQNMVTVEEKPGHLEVARLLIINGAKINQPDQQGQTPLHDFVDRGMLGVATLLIENGADPWLASNQLRITPLHRMADRGYSQLLELALKKRPQQPVDVQDAYGCTPLHFIGFSSYDNAKQHAELTALSDGMGMLLGDTPDSQPAAAPPKEISATIEAGHLATAKLLLAHGAQVNRTVSGEENRTPLHYAAEYGAASLAEILLAHGADTKATTSTGQTPLDLARAGQHQDVIRLLEKKNPATNAAPLAPELRALVAKAESGDATAQADLGLRYNLGNGLGQDFTKAAYWYLLAADQGQAMAQSNLAVLYTNGQGVQQNYQEAVRLYTLAADKGYALAKSNLGWMYHMGWGVAVDDQKAVALIQPVAEQGDVGSMVNMYNIHRQKNQAQAFLWCKKAAEGGDMYSMTNVGVLYETGAGTGKDLPKAKYWYGKAAAKGEIHAQETLRRLP